MKKNFSKKTIDLINKSNEFGIDDRLSSILKRDAELSEDELELVAAAANPNYDKFKHMLEDKK